MFPEFFVRLEVRIHRLENLGKVFSVLQPASRASAAAAERANLPEGGDDAESGLCRKVCEPLLRIQKRLPFFSTMRSSVDIDYECDCCY
jgi:hypothetical protein